MKLLANLKQRARQLKSEAQVLLIAYQDKRTPLAAKILIGITIGYLFSPIDLIPDFIPVLGLLDDLVIVPALIVLSLRLIPEIVVIEARERLKNAPRQYQKNNWIVGILIILMWLTVIYLVFEQARHFWK
ncbi:YkvA family protein [Paraflavisolibacter sp. H34]|uniref:YkvA family protein n=1 Tax=Huijunlia imazamoxiresistens TaxID=3127457 RepID=UPI003017A1D4